jgi:hypothetical protein
MGVPRGRIMRRTQRTGDTVTHTYIKNGTEYTIESSKGGIYNFGGNMKGGLMGGIGKSYHFHLQLAACCRNSNGGKGLGVNLKAEDANTDTLS